ncbi:hypothetical protein K469DRAFT_693993 [Zopfia rhizophila CBS 207.26]|uniref:Uncharacterized protein n=1 Tax=Zopfia rhizophila CBS 207.26 TaxID=1314779 RepID=A0A6A6DK29_9PEZI|nr:hypothetical protein K469DRAFT_693993 [Zopfia rhizophila CBS 207.26]
MFFNTRSLSAAALVSLFAYNARALDLKPITDPSVITGHPSARDLPGHECFDPTSQNSFFWGAYAEDDLYIANFTLTNQGEDELILPMDNFAKRLKSVKCGDGKGPMVIEFDTPDSYKYAKSAWDWVNTKSNHSFTLVTNANQCYQGDDRSPYLVSKIDFDEKSLKANLQAEEKEWADIAHTYHLKLGHEFIDPEQAANGTHRLMHLLRRDELTKRADQKVMDIGFSYDKNLFHYEKGKTNGLDLKADAQIRTAGKMITDLDVKTDWFIPTDVNIRIHPQGVHATFMLALTADGRLGKAIDWTMTPEIEIPVQALKIGKLLEIGPFVTMGVHFGTSQLEAVATASMGAKASLDDKAEVAVDIRNPKQNRISGWTPKFEKIDPQFSAEIKGGVRAWAELGMQIKAEVFGKWGYQASVDAQLPYFEANLAAQANTLGVCGTKKTKGVSLGAEVGINVNLNAGKVNEAPDFQKDLFETSWPLFSTCMGVGKDDARTGTIATAGGRTTEKASKTTAKGSNSAKPTGTKKETDATPKSTDKVASTGSGKPSSAASTGSGKATTTAKATGSSSAKPTGSASRKSGSASESDIVSTKTGSVSVSGSTYAVSTKSSASIDSIITSLPSTFSTITASRNSTARRTSTADETTTEAPGGGVEAPGMGNGGSYPSSSYLTYTNTTLFTATRSPTASLYTVV